MDYIQARKYKDSLRNRGSIYGLKTVSALAKKGGEPQNKIPQIHIAGTNGKGSVGAFLAQIFAQAGYRVGRFVSPALFCERESILYLEKNADTGEVYRHYIGKTEYADTMMLLKEQVDKLEAQGTFPTAFEVEYMQACHMFVKWNCDVAVVEAGLGGGEDATNIVCSPLLSVITDIGMDHMALLGDTLTEIAKQKAGIIKKGGRFVTIRQQPQVMEVLEAACKHHGVFMQAADFGNVKDIQYSLEGNQFSYCDFTGEETDYKIFLHGECQIRNAILSIETAKILSEQFCNINGETIKKGMETTRWQGRFERVLEQPCVVIDGAHNVAAAKMLVKSIQNYLHGKEIIAVMGVFKDKDYKGIIEEVISHLQKVYTVQPPGERGLDQEALARQIKKYGKTAIACTGVKQALGYANADVMDGEDKVILVFGSLSFLWEVYDFYKISVEDI